MAELENYTYMFQDDGGATFTGGGVMATDDQDAIIRIAREVRKQLDNFPGLPSYRVFIHRPDGTQVGAAAQIDEFTK